MASHRWKNIKKIFLNLEKNKAIKNMKMKMEKSVTQITTDKEVNLYFKRHEKLMKCWRKVKRLWKSYYKKDIIEASNIISNNRTLGNKGLIKEFYKTFLNQLKEPFMDLLNYTKISEPLIQLQRQAVIRLLEKNWTPILLLND